MREAVADRIRGPDRPVARKLDALGVAVTLRI
jgi:hypothetical protein